MIIDPRSHVRVAYRELVRARREFTMTFLDASSNLVLLEESCRVA